MSDAVFTTPEAAAFLGVSSSTMRNWRRRGQGPPYHGVPGRGGLTLYNLSDLKVHKERNTPDNG